MSAKGERIAKYLEEVIQKRGITKSGLATYAGVKHPTVGRWLKGEDVPSPESCRKLAAYLHVSQDFLLGLAGHRIEQASIVPPSSYIDLLRRAEEEAPIGIPVYAQISHAGEGAGVPTEYVYLEPRVARGRKLAALYVRGDCMAPAINDGDRIVIDLEASPRVGDIVVVAVDKDEVEVRRFVGAVDGRVRLACENPGFTPIEVEDVRIIGVVIDSGRRWRD